MLVASCPWNGDLMYGLKPIYDFIDLDYTAQVKTIKDSMFVVFNRNRGMLLVMDRDITNSPYVVMRVQEPDGKPRPFDGRVLEDLRRMVQRGPDVRKMIQELDQIDSQRVLRVDKEAEDIQYGLDHDMKWAGIDVVPSTAWVARSIAGVQYRQRRVGGHSHTSPMREAIRAAAR